MSLILFLMASWGAAYVVCYSRIFGRIHLIASSIPPQFVDHYQTENGLWIARPTGKTWLGELLECPACVGWWVGLALSFLLSPSRPYLHVAESARNLVACLVDGAIASGFCFVMGTLRMLADAVMESWRKP